jgi:biotin carboxyl carrier protein
MADGGKTSMHDGAVLSTAGIRALADLCLQSGVDELEAADGSWSVRLKLDRAASSATIHRPEEDPSDEQRGPHVLVSQWVGVFHRAAESGAPSIVEEGQALEEGELIGVIAAMQLQHEVRADHTGVLQRFLVQDRTAVEYGQPLLEIS